MNSKQAYNIWAAQYDTNINKTRDLEAISLRLTLANIPFTNCLEIGCGTGKNTEWLMTKATHITAVDLSEEMLAIAKNKISSKQVEFIQTDITDNWSFTYKKFDLAVFSLVIEHIENLNDIFIKLSELILTNGYVYISELHPFKQYLGSKARFETENGQQIVTCYNHHISDFTISAKNNNFEIVSVEEFFDNEDRSSIPRILTLLLRKNR
jgi:2-polyprenyl-3-methyl-5-hydroxy-6-metoxy-1,4-benzoquinol methylase